MKTARSAAINPQAKARTGIIGLDEMTAGGLSRARTTLVHGGPEPVPARAQWPEEDLSPFFTLSLDLLCVAGLDGYFKQINPAWETCIGWTKEELLARPFLDLVHNDDLEPTVAEVEKLARGEVTIAFENRYRGKDGAYRWLAWNAKSLPERKLIYATARDVTVSKRLQKEIIEATDQEKERLGRELHDGLCQNLVGIAALGTTLSRKLAARADPGAADAAEIATLLNQTAAEARDMAHGLNPAGLTQLGLIVLLEALAVSVRSVHGVACTFECDRNFPRLDVAIEAHLYRIAQQAVNNALTHGQGKLIAISLRGRDRRGLLRIQDDGVGISQSTLLLHGVGLHTMHYRARLIGASLEARPIDPHGTVLTCAFPLPLS